MCRKQADSMTPLQTGTALGKVIDDSPMPRGCLLRKL
jgi:hypothetical protein